VELRNPKLEGFEGVRQDGTSLDDFMERLQLAWHHVCENLNEAGMSYKDIVNLIIYMVEQIDPTERRSAFAFKLNEIRMRDTLICFGAWY